MRGVAFPHPPHPQLRVPGLQGMILQISGSLPSLSGMEMACDYGHGIHTVARVPGPAFGHQIAYCNLLPKDQFPPFPPHQGRHLTARGAGTADGGPRMVDSQAWGGPDGTAAGVGGPPVSSCPLSLDALLCSRPRDRRDVSEGPGAEHCQGQLHHLRLRPGWPGVPTHSVSGVLGLASGVGRRLCSQGSPLKKNDGVAEAGGTLGCSPDGSFVQQTLITQRARRL